MAEHTVLLVDSDTTLSEHIRTALLPYGCRGVALTDASEVLSHSLVPALIVLCIDPKRTGWANCMRIKKHAVMRNVPLIVTSAEASEKDFEEHKKLKTRADEYEQKPFAVAHLVDKIRALLGGLELQAGGELDQPPGTEEISMDDAIELDEGAADFDDSTDATHVGRMSDIFGLETDAAFAQIAVAPGSSAPSQSATTDKMPLLAAGGSAEPVGRTPHESNGRSSAVRLPPPAPQPKAAIRVLEAVPIAAFPLPASLGLPTLTDEIAGEELASLRAEREQLIRELSELKSRSSERTAQSPAMSRETLGLRETINRRDKEILDLKDLLDGKDREMLNARDRLRELERARREVDEKLLLVEKDLISMQERNDTLLRDKELGHERERGLKGRLEDAQKKLERAHAGAEEWKARHGTDVEAAMNAAAAAAAQVTEGERAAAAEREKHALEKAALSEAHGGEKAALSEAHAGEKTALLEAHGGEKKALIEAHGGEKKALIEAHDGEKKALIEAHDGEKQALIEAHDGEKQEIHRTHAGEKAALVDLHAGEKVALVEAHASEKAANAAASTREKTALFEAHESEKAALVAAHAADKGAAVDALEGEKARLVEAHEGETARLREAHAGEKARLVEAHEGDKAGLIEAHGAEKAALVAEKAGLVAAHGAEKAGLVAAHDEVKAGLAAQVAELSELVRNEQAAQVELRAAHAASFEAAQRGHGETVASLKAEHEAALATAHARHESARSDAERRHAAAMALEEASHQSTLDELGAQLAARASELVTLVDKRALETVAHEQLASAHEGLGAEHQRLLAEHEQRVRELVARDQRISDLQTENAGFQEQIVKAYHRMKNDETVVARAKKALSIALTLLGDEPRGPA